MNPVSLSTVFSAEITKYQDYGGGIPRITEMTTTSLTGDLENGKATFTFVGFVIVVGI